MKKLIFFSMLLTSLCSYAVLPQANFTFSNRDITEGQEITVSAQLSEVSPDGVILPFAVSGTADGEDHDLIDGAIYISPNHTKGSVTFRVFDDGDTENVETIIMTLLAPTNAELGTTKVHTINIHDDLHLPKVNFNGSNTLIREGNILNIPVTISQAVSQMVIVPFVVSGTAQFPGDHNLISGNLTFLPGSTTASLSVTLNEDGLIEDNETVIINLKAPIVNASLGSQTVFVVTVEATYPGIRLEGVNQTANSVVMDEGNGVAKLELLSGSNPVGGFNGGGVGNKAYLGFSKYNAVPLSEFVALTFKTKVPMSSPLNRNVYLNMQVDLNCNPSNPNYAIIVVDYMFATPGPKDQWNTYTVQAVDQVYRSVGGKGGLPSHISSQTGVLSTVTTNYPSACLVNASTGDGGQKKNAILPSILLVLGDSATTTASYVYIDDVVATFTNATDNYNFTNN